MDLAPAFGRADGAEDDDLTDWTGGELCDLVLRPHKADWGTEIKELAEGLHAPRPVRSGGIGERPPVGVLTPDGKCIYRERPR